MKTQVLNLKMLKIQVPTRYLIKKKKKLKAEAMPRPRIIWAYRIHSPVSGYANIECRKITKTTSWKF